MSRYIPPSARPGCAPAIEALEPRIKLSAAVVGFVLVDAETDQDIMPLSQNMVIDEAMLPTRNVNIRADVQGSASAVRFDLDRTLNFRTESGAPYSLAGDDGGDYHHWRLPRGVHMLTATPFFNDGQQQATGDSLTVRFSVISTNPSSLTATPVSWGQIDLQWNDDSDYEGNFLIERSVDGEIDLIDFVDANVTSYTDLNVSPGVSYSYRVAAVTFDGTRTLFSNDDDALISTAVPEAPTELTATPLSFQAIALEWEDASGNESAFRILRSDDRRRYEFLADVGPLVTTFTDLDLNPESTYYYRVYAVNPTGPSSNAPAASAVTFPRPPVEERRGAHNTGYTGELVDWTGDNTIATPGLYENFRFTGNVRIEVGGVTLRNCEIIGSGVPGSAALIIDSDLEDVLVEHSEIRNGGASIVTIKSGTLQYSNIHTAQDDAVGVGGEGVRILYNYIHHPLGEREDAHADGIQIATGQNIQIIGNNIDMPKDVPETASNAAIFIKSSSNIVDNVLIEDNWLNGGNFTIFVHSDDIGAFPPPSNVVIRGNWFGRDNRFGVKNIHSATGTLWEDNRWWDTGALIP